MAKAPDLNEIFRPIRLMTIASEAVAEVTRAHEKHGPNTNLSEGVGPGRSILQEIGIQGGVESNHDLMLRVQHFNDTRCAQGNKHTRAGIVLEEFVEALAATTSDERRTELIQTIAMLLDWVGDLDARPDDIDEVCS
jgi:hypothetical protein